MAETRTLDATDIDRLQAQIDRVAQLFEMLAARRAAGGRSHTGPSDDPLFGLGRRLHQLLPAGIQQALAQLPAHELLTLAAGDNGLPWELVHDGAEYLVLKQGVARQHLAFQPPQPSADRRGRPWRALLIGNPTEDLPQAGQEIEHLRELLKEAPGAAPPQVLTKRRATKEIILQHLASGAFDLIHFSGHAWFDAHHPGAGGLVLAGGALLTAAEIQQTLSGEPVLFLNGCESARTAGAPLPTPGAPQDLALTGLNDLGLAAQGLARACLQGGALAVIGAIWPLADAGSHEFALAFYRRALDGTSIATALQHARDAAHARYPLDPLWATYALYGNPELVLCRP